jgi:hypothetical protein
MVVLREKYRWLVAKKPDEQGEKKNWDVAEAIG